MSPRAIRSSRTTARRCTSRSHGVNAVQVLDPQTDRIVATVPTGASPHIAAYFRGAPAATAVVQGPGELLLFGPATNAPVRTVAVGKQPHWVAASADGKRAYVTNEGSNDLSVVDLTSGQVTTIAVGNAPRKVVVQQSAAKTFARTFDRPGSYDYLCSVHPYMSGKVIVRAP